MSGPIVVLQNALSYFIARPKHAVQNVSVELRCGFCPHQGRYPVRNKAVIICSSVVFAVILRINNIVTAVEHDGQFFFGCKISLGIDAVFGQHPSECRIINVIRKTVLFNFEQPFMCAALRFCVCFVIRRCVSLRQVHKAVVERVQAESYLIKVFSGTCGKLRIILRRQIPITYIVAFFRECVICRLCEIHAETACRDEKHKAHCKRSYRCAILFAAACIVFFCKHAFCTEKPNEKL